MDTNTVKRCISRIHTKLKAKNWIILQYITRIRLILIHMKSIFRSARIRFFNQIFVISRLFLGFFLFIGTGRSILRIFADQIAGITYALLQLFHLWLNGMHVGLHIIRQICNCLLNGSYLVFQFSWSRLSFLLFVYHCLPSHNCWMKIQLLNSFSFCISVHLVSNLSNINHFLCNAHKIALNNEPKSTIEY